MRRELKELSGEDIIEEDSACATPWKWSAVLRRWTALLLRAKPARKRHHPVHPSLFLPAGGTIVKVDCGAIPDN
jgi:hypothetical protein